MQRIRPTLSATSDRFRFPSGLCPHPHDFGLVGTAQACDDGHVPGAELEAIGVARHLAGDYAGAMDAYERAHAAYRREGDLLAAARAARTVGWFRGWVFGDWAVHRGWMGRARRLLDGSGPAGRQAGWRLLDAAQSGGDLEIQREQYEAVIEIARRNDDPDLECEAQASLGMMLVFSGLVDAGMAHLDEALAALCAGDIEELPVLEGCLCGLFNACERTHDVRRVLSSGCVPPTI